eukprot:4501380-Amphidinium_carterae.1
MLLQALMTAAARKGALGPSDFRNKTDNNGASTTLNPMYDSVVAADSASAAGSPLKMSLSAVAYTAK